MAMKIKNVKGTSRLTCNCRTWKKHWKNMTGLKWPKKCGIKGCSNPAEVGAHVQYDDRRTGNYWYILPMCNSHNAMKHNLKDERVDGRFRGDIWANRGGTCGY